MLGLGKSKNQTFIGLDFGSSCIKALVISRHGKGYRVEAVAEAPAPKGAISDDLIQDVDRVANLVKQMRKTLGNKLRFAATAASGSNVFSKTVPMDANLDEVELETQIELEAESIIPFPLDEVSYDFEVIGPFENDNSRNDVLVCAARTEAVAALSETITGAGLTPKVIDIGSHALTRGAALSLKEVPPVYGIVDIGAAAMNFIAVRRGEVSYTRAQSFGGNDYTKAISEFYGFEFEKAENDKLANKLPVDYDIDVLSGYIHAAVGNIRRQVQMYLATSGVGKINNLVLTGGGALVPGLANQLQNELSEMGITVIAGNPFKDFTFARKEDKQLLEKEGARYVTALGLALRSFMPCQI